MWGQTADATINTGDELTFKPESFTFSASPENSGTIAIVMGEDYIRLYPGQTATLNCDDDDECGDDDERDDDDEWDDD